jgi:hypothetical protein
MSAPPGGEAALTAVSAQAGPGLAVITPCAMITA